MYVREDLISSLVPSLTGWFAQEDIWAMDISRYAPAHSARRFEAGTPPVPNTYMAEAGLAILHKIGLEAIEARIQYLTGAIKDAAGEAKYRLATPADPAQHAAMMVGEQKAGEGFHGGYGIGIGYRYLWHERPIIRAAEEHVLEAGTALSLFGFGTSDDNQSFLFLAEPIIVTETGLEDLSRLPREQLRVVGT